MSKNGAKPLIKFFLPVLLGITQLNSIASASVCGDLNKLYQSSSINFSDIKGKYDKEYEGYVSKWSPEGVYDACDLSVEKDDEGTFKYFSCRWKTTPAQGPAMYQSLVNEVRACKIAAVGPSESKSTQRGNSYETATTYRLKEKVKVKIKYYSSRRIGLVFSSY